MKTTLSAAGLLLLASTFNAHAEQGPCSTDSSITCRTVDSNTYVMRGNQPQYDRRSGIASFFLDARRVDFFDYTGNDYVAIASPGTTIGRGTECPYFDIAKQRYNIDKTNIRRVFRIRTNATQSQINAADKHGCIITKWPSWSRISPLL